MKWAVDVSSQSNRRTDQYRWPGSRKRILRSLSWFLSIKRFYLKKRRALAFGTLSIHNSAQNIIHPLNKKTRVVCLLVDEARVLHGWHDLFALGAAAWLALKCALSVYSPSLSSGSGKINSIGFDDITIQDFSFHSSH
jgi:hypothetical protein